jgi:hypothetical protein
VFVLFRFADIFQSKLNADSMTFNAEYPKVWLYGHLYFVISTIGFVIRSFYDINSSVVSLFVIHFFFSFKWTWICNDFNWCTLQYIFFKVFTWIWNPAPCIYNAIFCQLNYTHRDYTLQIWMNTVAFSQK